MTRFEAHLPLVRAIAVATWERMPRYVEIDDLHQEGVIGLMQADERYDPACGV